MLVRVFNREDGGVSILKPNERLRLKGETDNAFIERIAAGPMKNDPGLAKLKYIDVEEASLPSDRTDRNSWRLEGKKIVVLAEK